MMRRDASSFIALQESSDFPVNVRAKGKNLIERWARKGGTELLFGNLLAERDVIAVEETMELFAEWFVIHEKGPQHECFEEPGGMGLMPFHRTGLRT
jgi:hypothetical protein